MTETATNRLEVSGTRATSAGSDSAAKEIPEAGSAVLDRSDPEFFAKAYDVYAEMRAKGPIVRARHSPLLRDEDEPTTAPTGERVIREMLFVNHYEEAAAALVDDRLAVNPHAMLTPEQQAKLPPMPAEMRPLLYSLLMLDPPDHTRLRKLVQPSFSARAMEDLRPRVQRLADELLDKAEQEAAARGEAAPDRQMELVKAFAYPLPVRVISDMLGIPEEDREAIRQWTEMRLNSRNTPEAIEENRKMVKGFSAYLLDLFERKRRAPANDMITQMIQAQEDGDKLDENELLSMVFILYMAGHVTTVNLIGNGVAALLTHPDQLARFKADPGLVKGVVEETLRYWSPVDYLGSTTMRTATEPMDIGGAPIPRGAHVGIGLSAANRDPAQFKDPDAYDIGRADAHRHIAFGKGIHLCLGAPLARVEGQIAFETLFRRFPEMRLAIPAEDLRWGGTAGLRGFREVPVLF